MKSVLGVSDQAFQDQGLCWMRSAKALDRDRVARQKQSNLPRLRKRYEALTASEREVMGLRSVEHAQ